MRKLARRRKTIQNIKVNELSYKNIKETDYIYSIIYDLLIGINNVQNMIPEAKIYYEKAYDDLISYLKRFDLKILEPISFLRYAYSRARLSNEIAEENIYNILSIKAKIRNSN